MRQPRRKDRPHFMFHLRLDRHNRVLYVLVGMILETGPLVITKYLSPIENPGVVATEGPGLLTSV